MDTQVSVSGFHSQMRLLSLSTLMTSFPTMSATGSQIKFQTANFIVYDPSTGVQASPFVISGGATYINKAIIKNADIDTLKIQGNSVTQAVAVQGAGDTTVGTSNTTVLSGSITLSGNQPTLVNCTAFIGGGSNSGSLNTGGNTAIGTVQIGSYTQTFVPALTTEPGKLINGSGSCLFTGIPAGTYNVSIVFRAIDTTSAAPAFFVRSPAFSILETKR